MKKRFNKFSLVPIPFILVLLYILIFLDDVSDTVFMIVLFLVGSSFYITFGLLTSADQYNTKKWFNADKIKNLDLDIYGHYARITKQFSFRYDVVKENVILVNENDKLRLENFIVMIVKHNRFLPVYRRRFEELNHTDALYYQFIHIYSLYYLLENDVAKFQAYYKQFKDTIELRSESRILHEKLHRIMFGKDYYDIPLELIELLYDYYVLDIPIDKEIVKYRPKCALDEMIYITLLYHYYEATENKKMLSDMEEEYLKYKKIRRNL